VRLGAPVVVLCVLALLGPGCGGSDRPSAVPTPGTSPTPPLPTDVVVGPRSGPTEIAFVVAEPPPGSTISGCGPNASGCAGRVQMRFRLLSASGGPVLSVIGFLHATNKLACYRGSTGPLELRPGVPSEVVIAFDQPDAAACAMPATIANMKVVLNAPIQTDGMQEWGVRYELRP
jgi:hypothetical protein